MAVEGITKCVKYLLFFFNFIFWLCGVALIVVGILAQVTLKSAAVNGISGTAMLIIVVGVIIFFIAFFGCCGAWKENYCMITTFAIFLSIIIIVEIAGAIAAYVFRGKLNVWVKGSLKEMITNYNTTEDMRKAIDGIQKQLKCCGSSNSDDWKNFKPDHNSVPDSCCKNATKDCGNGAMHDGKKIYKFGCATSMEKLLNQSLLWVGVAALVIAFVQFTGIVLACVLMKGIRSGYEVM